MMEEQAKQASETGDSSNVAGSSDSTKKVEDETTENKFISSGKWTGSKDGYIFQMVNNT